MNRRALFVILLILLPASASAQSMNLRDLLTDFLRQGITLADPSDPQFPSHAAHFIGEDSPQFAALQQFSTQFATQLSSYPLPSPGGGFTYAFDPALGVLNRSSESFGPIFGERAGTIGRGRFNVGINRSSYSYESLGEMNLRDGDVRLVFTHEDSNRDQSHHRPWFEGDVVTAQVFLKAESDVTSFVLNYGLSDRLDVGAAVPLIDVSIRAQSDIAVQRIATGSIPIHVFPNGTSHDVVAQSGSASGVGDVALRLKYHAIKGSRGGLALAGDLRLPTGAERDLLGTGATRIGALVIGSFTAGKFSPHANLGYAVSGDVDAVEQPDEVTYALGFDLAVSPRMTFAVDGLGTTRLDSGIVEVEETLFDANVAQSGPPQIVTATFPRLVVHDGNASTYLGSVGVKVNVFNNVLLTVNGLFGIDSDGLKPQFSPMFGLDYSF